MSLHDQTTASDQHASDVAPVAFDPRVSRRALVAGTSKLAVLATMLDARSMRARRRTILVFYDPGAGKPVERLTVSRYGIGDLFKSAWTPETQPDQWQRLAELVVARDPRKIAVNISDATAFGDLVEVAAVAGAGPRLRLLRWRAARPFRHLPVDGMRYRLLAKCRRRMPCRWSISFRSPAMSSCAGALSTSAIPARAPPSKPSWAFRAMT